DITQGQIWSRDTGACVVKDNIVIAFVNGSRYDKAISIKLHNIEFPLTYNFWKEAGAKLDMSELINLLIDLFNMAV
ncbi:unnamed protein product, partial [Onchocerca ochengi]